jgi:HAD superfamily hydrolase (TIGR01509 family)
MMRDRAILFDVDGTLAETERDGHRVAFNAAFADAGLPWHWDPESYGKLLRVAGGKERIAAFAQRFDRGWFAQADVATQIAHLHRRKNAHYAALVARGAIALRPGVRELFDALAASRARLALVTTTSRSNLTVLLQTALGADALKRFAVIVAGEDVARKKPSPDAYLLALERLGLPAEATIAVEDSTNGLLAAQGAEIATVIVRSHYTQAQDFNGALALFDDYAVGDGGGLGADFLLRVQPRVRIGVE